jgi:hypothetical protein
LQYRVLQKGLFTDIDGTAHLLIPVERLERIVVRVKHGDISVVNARDGEIAADRLPQLDLATGDGRVQQW